MLAALTLGTGCATRDKSPDPGTGTGGTGPTPIGADYAYVTGNWKFAAKDSKAAATTPPDVFAGVVYEQGGSTLPHFATSVLRSTSPCYTGATVVPSDGSVNSSSLQLASFSVLGQVLTIGLQKDSTAQALTGTYSIAGGACAGQTGTLTGQKYAAVNGSYSGSFDSTTQHSVVLNLSQNEGGTGEGTFVLSGSANFSGLSCVTTGTIDPNQSFVSGSDISVSVTANASTTVVLNGTIDPTAKTVQLQSTTVSGGTCAATFSGGTLTRS